MALITSDCGTPRSLQNEAPHTMNYPSNEMALTTSDCGTTRSPRIKWP